MKYNYRTHGTCSTFITFELEGDVVSHIQYTGGCNGNLKAISTILDGWTVSDIEKKCLGIQCGRSATSCSDQLAKAVRAAYDKEQAEAKN